jgi:hypothetical protein
MTQKNKKPNHHETPKYYLSGFCASGTSSELCVFERRRPFKPGIKAGKDNPINRGLRTFALRADAYVARDIDGKSHYNYENAFEKIEKKAEPAIRKIRKFDAINADEKELLAEYIVTMVKRRTLRDAKLLPRVEKVRAEISQVAEREMRKAALEGDLPQAFEIWRQASHYDEIWLLRESMIQNVGMAQQALITGLWEFVKAPPGCYFVTSDNPVGNAPLLTTLVFPVSQNIVLTYATTQRKDLSYRQATPDEMRKINAYIILQAEKEVYSPQPDQWILTGWTHGF